MDIMDMTYPDKSFDVVLDKGTMDAIMATLPSSRTPSSLSHPSLVRTR